MVTHSTVGSVLRTPSKYWGRFHSLVNENRNWLLGLREITAFPKQNVPLYIARKKPVHPIYTYAQRVLLQC